MATSSLSSSVFTSCNSSAISLRHEAFNLSPLLFSKPLSSINPRGLRMSSSVHHPTTRVFATPETLEAEELDTEDMVISSSDPSDAETSSLGIGADSDKMVPKQKIRIKLRSYWVPLIEDSCKQIMDAARNSNAKTVGPVPLPTKKRIYCVLKSPHVNKDARFHFEIRTHQRLIDIHYPTAQTIDSLMQLDLPAGVDVEVKL